MSRLRVENREGRKREPKGSGTRVVKKGHSSEITWGPDDIPETAQKQNNKKEGEKVIRRNGGRRGQDKRLGGRWFLGDPNV